MTTRSVAQGTFTIERRYDAAAARVFRAWARADQKLQWFACHEEWKVSEHLFDFRPGGRERVVTGPAGGAPHRFEARYHDIVEGERIVYSYEMWIGEQLISVSVATVEFFAEGTQTRLRMTEQGAYLDGLSTNAEREEGTAVGLDGFAHWLARTA